jgi:hypothetical protein
MPETGRQSPQVNKIIEIFDYIRQKRRYSLLGLLPRKTHIPNLTKPFTPPTKLRNLTIYVHTWWWVGLCWALCCKTRHPCGAKNRCQPQHKSSPIPWCGLAPDGFQQRQQPLNPHVASQPIRGLSWGPNALFSYYQTAPNLRLQTRAFRERERERERGFYEAKDWVILWICDCAPKRINMAGKFLPVKLWGPR